MKRANWLIMFLLAFAVAVPASAVEVTLGGFPSYMSTRARYIENATYKNAAATGKKDDSIFFVDTTLRLTPQLVLSDAVTIRAQVDIFDNNIWGGQTDQLLGGGSTLVNSQISPSDKFRGTILHGNGTTDCLNFGRFCAVEKDAGFFNVRMLHADIVLPNDLGFVRIGRQPFDWGLGLLANGGWDPNSDGGFLVDRFLWLKSFPTGPDMSLTAIFVSDRITQGTGLNTGAGDGWDGGAVAFVWNHANMGGINVTLGGYVFPYIHQDDFLGSLGDLSAAGITTCCSEGVGFGDLDRFTLYSGLIDLKSESWKFTGELQGGFGEISGILGGTGAASKSKIKNAIIWAVRGEYLAPTLDYLNVVGAEFGWADGDKNEGGAWFAGQDIEGGVIVFNPAYNLDNLMFKHVMPSIYQDAHGNIIAKADASVQNAYYARLYTSMPITDRITFSPQVLVGWNNETEGLIRDGFCGAFTNAGCVVGTVPNSITAIGEGGTLGVDDSGGSGRKTVTAAQPKDKVSSYLGTEVEGTFTINIHPGVNLDIIGSLIVAGDGLTELLEAQSFARANVQVDTDPATDGVQHREFADADTANGALITGQKANDIIWGVQTKLTIYIDEFFKS